MTIYWKLLHWQKMPRHFCFCWKSIFTNFTLYFSYTILQNQFHKKSTFKRAKCCVSGSKGSFDILQLLMIFCKISFLTLIKAIAPGFIFGRKNSRIYEVKCHKFLFSNFVLCSVYSSLFTSTQIILLRNLCIVLFEMKGWH